MRPRWNLLNYNAIGAVALLLLVSACGGGKVTTTAPVPVAATNPATTMAGATTAPAEASPVAIVSDKGFTCRCTGHWQSRAGNATCTLVPMEDPNDGLRVITLDVPWIPVHIPGMITSARVEKGFVNDVKKKMQDVNVDSDADQAFPDSKARRVHIHARAGSQLKVIDCVMVIHHDSVYILDAETDPAGADDAHKAMELIVGSWHWTK
jgi:hypothetical protein